MVQHAQKIELGDLTLRRIAGSQRIVGQTIARKDTSGSARMYVVAGWDGLRLTIRDVSWGTGERDVAVWDRHDAAQRYDRLRSGLRLQVDARAGQLYVELRQARLKETEWSNLFAADRAELDAGAGVDVVATLQAVGATAVDTRERLFDDSGPAKERVGALFPVAAEDVPAVAYVLTRIAPLRRGVRA